MTEDHSYDDIIHKPHCTSRKRPRMPLINRAAQFAPFAALTGFDGLVKETARLTDRYIELDEDSLRRLNMQLQRMLEHIADQPAVRLTLFVPDERKEGGAYRTVDGRVRRIDTVSRELILTDRRVIPLSAIHAIRCQPAEAG